MAARGDAPAGVAAAGRAIDAAARICLLADRQPYPYGKWLLRAARDSRLGPAVTPVLDEIAATIGELSDPPEGVDFRVWTPIARLRQLRAILSSNLPAIGWAGPWVTDLGLNLPLVFRGA
ncbi:MAG: hypothetical protein HN712_08045 [Gemmatimonadetes bacterium]|nr:hypothetical protein [Gemmatimonadota bacterium]MBT7860250.1 hypothetical protein [Gemmatimonadota bacterium]